MTKRFDFQTMAQEYFYIEVDKGNKPSYGMTLLGTGPCIVSDVVSDGPADHNGVRPGFVVLEIDGINVINRNHKEVREIIREAETNNGAIQFKFATLDVACHFFGRGLRETFENSRSRRKSCDSARQSQSPKTRKTEGNARMVAVMAERQPSGETKDNNSRLSQSVAVQVDYHMDSPNMNHTRRIQTPSRDRKPTQPRYGDLSRRPHIQTRDLTRWMRSADAQQLSSSPLKTSPATPNSPVTEFVCLYYLNLVDLLGPVEEGVFRQNVAALKNQSKAQFWARLAVTDKRLTIYRPEGKYVSYSQKNMRDVFVHDDGNYFGFTAVRLSRVESVSSGTDTTQTMDVYSCHIMFVDPDVKGSKLRQREILSDLFGKDRLLVTSNTGKYFPHNAIDVASALRTLIKVESSPDETMVVSKARSNASTVDLLKESREMSVSEDATANFNSASDLRNSMRKYGPYLGMSRHSISTDNVVQLNRPQSGLVHPRLSSISGMYANGLPQTISETEVMISSLASSQSDGIGSMSSCDEEFERCLRRDAVSSFDLTGKNDSFVTPVKQVGTPMKKLEMLDILRDPKGVNLFQAFLRQEHSEENIAFWLACEEYRVLKKSREIEASARRIFDRYLSLHAAESVNIDSDVRKVIERNLKVATTCLFDTAAKQVFDLMNTDSFPRFVKSAYYGQLMLVLYPDTNLFHKSVMCLDKKDSSLGSARNSSIFGWLGKKKNDPDTPRSGRQSLPAAAVDSVRDPRRNSVVKNPIQKLIEKGRKSFSARVKSSRRESLMEFLGDNRTPPANSSRPAPLHINVSPVPFEFRKPLTPPPKMEVVVRRERKTQSGGKEKRLSLQSFQRIKSKETTIPTEWTFSRSSLDGLENVGPAQSARLARESVSYVNFERNIRS